MCWLPGRHCEPKEKNEHMPLAKVLDLYMGLAATALPCVGGGVGDISGLCHASSLGLQPRGAADSHWGRVGLRTETDPLPIFN